MRKRKQELAKEQEGAGDDTEEMAKKADLGKNIKIESKTTVFDNFYENFISKISFKNFQLFNFFKKCI